MQIINNPEQLKELQQGNRFIGTIPKMENSIIKFNGENNILFCDKNIKLVNSKIEFRNNNSIVYLCENRHNYKLNIAVNNHSAFYMGRNNYINAPLNAIASEHKHIFIGDDGLYSFGIWMLNADPHLIYNSKTKERLNETKSIFIGDHVWIGQQALILKGTKIYSGSIVGGMSVVAGKQIPSNTSWSGNPARQKSSGFFWEGSCVNVWDEQKTKEMQHYESDEYIFNFDKEKYIKFEEIDEKLISAKDSEEMYNYLSKIANIKEKNRFANNLNNKKRTMFSENKKMR